MRHGCLSHENEDGTVPALCRRQTCFLLDQQGFLPYFPFQINAYSWEIHGKPPSLKVRLFHVLFAYRVSQATCWNAES